MRRGTPLLLLLAAACAGQPEFSLLDAGVPDWVCTKTYRIGEDFFWITRLVDGAGAPKELSARWRSTDAELAWRIRDPARWFEHPTEARLEIRLNEAPAEAVSTQVFADGVLVDEREQLSRRTAQSHSRGAPIILAASFNAPDKVPNLHGVKDLRMKAVAGGGRVVAEARLPLPDWSVAGRHVEEGRLEVDILADDFDSKCEQILGGEI